LDETSRVNERIEVINSDDDEVEIEPTVKGNELHPPVNAAQEGSEEVQETVEPRPSRVDMSRYYAFVEDAEDVQSCASAPVRDGSHDSGVESSYVSPASMPVVVEITAGSPYIGDLTATFSAEPAHQNPSDPNDELDSRPTSSRILDASKPSSEEPGIFQKATSYLSISSDEFVDAKQILDRKQMSPVTTAFRSISKPAPFGGSHIIDLCSDDEDVATSAASRRGVEATPDIGAMPRSARRSAGAFERNKFK
jgi:hypothetical protein